MTLAYNGDRSAVTVAIPTIDDVDDPTNRFLSYCASFMN